jgi:hypothetical protein
MSKSCSIESGRWTRAIILVHSFWVEFDLNMVTVYLDFLHEEDIPTGKLPFWEPIREHCDCDSDLLAIVFICRKTIYDRDGTDSSATRTRNVITSADTDHKGRAVSLA